MKTMFLADDDDALGFGIAGFACEVCRTRAAIETALARLTRDDILVFSSKAAALIPDRIDEWRHAPTGPMFVVLPSREDGIGDTR